MRELQLRNVKELSIYEVIMAGINETKVSLKSIADISEMKISFFIDAYQRGYRWSPIEVRDLLDDVREFGHSKKDESSFYCLQPIIVTQNAEGAYKVIDGQQRDRKSVV